MGIAGNRPTHSYFSVNGQHAGAEREQRQIGIRRRMAEESTGTEKRDERKGVGGSHKANWSLQILEPSGLDQSQEQRNEGKTAISTPQWVADFWRGHGTNVAKGLWLQGAGTPTERYELIEMLSSPLAPWPPPLTRRGVESEVEFWLWLLLCSWSCSEARTDWARERGFSATEQIPPLIRNAQGRKNPSQSATVWIWLIISLWFLEDLCQGFFQLHAANTIFLLYLKNWQQIMLKRNVTRANRVSLNGIRHN